VAWVGIENNPDDCSQVMRLANYHSICWRRR